MAEKTIGRYRLTKRIVKGDAARGAPEVWHAQDAGELYFVKLWRRKSVDDPAIQGLWNREVRGLARLQGYPGSRELFASLRDLGSSNEFFYVVIEGGKRMLLSEILTKRQNYNWLVNLNETGRRRSLWSGLARVAEALSILHNDGTLHRSLTTAALLVGQDGQGDFRLSGFEWSLRIAGLEGSAAKVGHPAFILAPELDRAEGEYSTATDWFDFGLVVAEIFGVPVSTLKKRIAVRSNLASLSTLRQTEKNFISRLLEENPESRLIDADEILRAIRDIDGDLNSVTSSVSRDLMLGVRLGEGVNLSEAVQRASNGAAKSSQPAAQRDWIRHDMRGDVRIIARGRPHQHFVIKGEKLEYRVRRWTSDGSSTWDVGFCEAVESSPRIFSDDQVFGTSLRKISVELFPYVRRNIRSISDRSAPWDKVFNFSKQNAQVDTHLRDAIDFFRVTQQLDTVITAAEICPIDVLDVERTHNYTTVVTTPLEEVSRTELARQLGLQSPAEQLRDWFKLGVEEVVDEDDDDPKRDRYSLLDRRTIGSDSSGLSWLFVRAYAHQSGPRYEFRTAGSPPVRQGRSYLAKNHGGTLAQIRRRHKAIEDLHLHEVLLRLISSPKDATFLSSDTLPEGRNKIRLDKSKVDVLSNLWRTRPAFFVQGPPGTGKTTLIRAFIDRQLSADRTSQILLTAHAHHTVDDVRVKVAKLMSTGEPRERPIIIRIGGKGETEHDVATISADLLKRLSASDAGKRSPDFVRERLASAIGATESAKDPASVDTRTMQSLVQDAANITFSTSNAAELADIASRGRRFDWSIIEEAGKAHGFDMAVALQVSHRLLLIGDHRQLPPFNAHKYEDLLANPLRVNKALSIGAQFAPGLVDPSVIDEEDGRESFEERCKNWRSLVRLFASIFDRSVPDYDEDAGAAATLVDQHRMHPDIADLVGKIFYPDGDDGTIINSPPETEEIFAPAPPFLLSDNSPLQDSRIIWYDVPWVQKEQYAEGETSGLFESEIEAELVARILLDIKPRAGFDCDLQILSPYNDQLDAIRRSVELRFSSGELAHMFEPPFDLNRDKRLGATVDQFQGSEADIVIVSLVRNNALVPWKSVGFLKESSRMNVLLSRARHKLIIVGSWDFFNSRCDEHTGEDAEYRYIGDMMKFMEMARVEKSLTKVPAR